MRTVLRVLVLATALFTGGLAPAAFAAPPDASAGGDFVMPPELIAKLSQEQIVALLREREAGLRPGGGILLPMAFFGTLAAVVLLSQLCATRRERMRQETLRAMVEKGITIPPDLDRRRGPPSDLRRGLVLIGAGLGLSLLFSVIRVSGEASAGLWAVGFVPLLTGLGYLAVWRIAAGSGSDR